MTGMGGMKFFPSSFSEGLNSNVLARDQGVPLYHEVRTTG